MEIATVGLAERSGKTKYYEGHIDKLSFQWGCSANSDSFVEDNNRTEDGGGGSSSNEWSRKNGVEVATVQNSLPKR